MPPRAFDALPRCLPESVGIRSSAVTDFLAEIDRRKLELHGLMLLRHGKVFAEGWWHPYAPERRHLLYSLSKSFTSTAIGMLVDEGRLSIDDLVVDFFPDETPLDASDNLRKMRVRDLLTMSAGHEADDMSELFNREDGDWVRGFLARPVPYEPGTHFLYNTSATYMCSAILSRVAGESLFSYLVPRLFDPLGIEGATWTTCPKGVTYGGSGLSVRTEDIAKFGLLYLQKGVWNGRRLVSEAWINQATSKQVPNGNDPDNDWNQGYGFQFWRCRHDSYRGDGAFGQYCVVIPSEEMVVAIMSSVDDLGGVLQALWNHIRYPAEANVMPSEAKSIERPETSLRVDGELPGPIGELSSPAAERVCGHPFLNDRRDSPYRSAKFEFSADGGCMIIFETDKGETDKGRRTVAVGGGAWDVHRSLGGGDVAMRGAWTDPETYEIVMKCLDGPEGRTTTCRFSGDQVACRETRRGYFGPAEGRSFTGRMAPGALS